MYRVKRGNMKHMSLSFHYIYFSLEKEISFKIMECGQENPVLTFIQSEVLTKSRHGRSNRQKYEILLLCKRQINLFSRSLQKIWAAFLLWSKNKLWHYFDFTISQHCHLCIIVIVIFALALITMENTCNVTTRTFFVMSKRQQALVFMIFLTFSAHLKIHIFSFLISL